MTQITNLLQPIIASVDGPPPYTIRVNTMPQAYMTQGGAQGRPVKGYTYVRYDILPVELQERVKMLVQALQSGM
jgi:hypothetical protein